jgi:hypothetical protein
MEIEQIILEYVKVLIWPSIILLGILIFKNSIKELISKITDISELSVGYKGLSLKTRVVQKMLEADLSSPLKSLENKDKKRSINDVVSILELPDDDFLFFEKIAKNNSFCVSEAKEQWKYKSLTNQGYFSKISEYEYEPTAKGKKILEALNNFGYRLNKEGQFEPVDESL